MNDTVKPAEAPKEAPKAAAETKAEAPKPAVKAEAAPKKTTARKAPTRKAPVAKKAAAPKAAAPKAAAKPAAKKAAAPKAAAKPAAKKAAPEAAAVDATDYAARMQSFADEAKARIEDLVKQGTDNYETAFNTVKEQFEGQFETLKGQFGDMNIDFNDVVEFNKANFDAFVEAGNKAAEAFDSLSTELRDFGTARWEDNVAAFKALTASKSVQEVVDLQKDFAKTSFETFKAEGEKLADMVPTLAKDVVAPIQDRATEAYDTFVKRDAA